MQFSPVIIISIIGFTLAAPQASQQARDLGIIAQNGQCGAARSCNDIDCLGTNDAFGKGGQGTCKDGFLKGCVCTSVCGKDSGDCNKNGCQGQNMASGALGFCTAGGFAGCECKSVCGDKDGACNANGCNGKNNICQSGDFKGCLCK